MGILPNTINEISEKNSSLTLLSASNTFIGDVENVLNFSSLELNIYSDVSSTANGIVLTCGQDKELTTGIYTELDTYTASENYHRVFPLKGRFMKIEYTNSGSDQTTFKLQAIKSNLPPNDNDANVITNLIELGNLVANLDINNSGINSNLIALGDLVANLDINNSGINSNLITINDTVSNLDINNSGINSNLIIINDTISNLDINNSGINSNLIALGDLVASLDINNSGINSNLITINDTISNLDINNSGINSNLTSILNYTEKPLTLFRNEGKCRLVNKSFNNLTSNSSVYISNTDANKIFYVYSIDCTVSPEITTSDNINFKLEFINDIYSANGTGIDYNNTKLYSTYNDINSIGFGLTSNLTFGTGIKTLTQSFNFLANGKLNTLNFMEEMIEIPSSNTLLITMEPLLNNPYTYLNIRWIEEDL